MRILLSAYACEPERGSEAEVGFRTMLAASTEHEVWVLTRQTNLPVLTEYLDRHPDHRNIHLVGVDLDRAALTVKRAGGHVGLHWYYDRWQASLEKRALELDAQVNFDVVHHVTFATYWTRVGIRSVRKPLVWGPVGGGADTPPRLALELGARGLAWEAIRLAGRTAAERRRHVMAAMQGAAVVIAQNPETADRIKSGKPVDVFSNGTASVVASRGIAARDGSRVVFGGRLVPLKAVSLAIRTMRYVNKSTARLVIYGDGPESNRARRLTRRWHLDDRVELVGAVPRRKWLDAVAGAGVLLHPALHDQASLAVAEALSFGTPVVCLNSGGPRVLAGLWEDSSVVAVPPSSPNQTARRMAEALDAFLQTPAPIPTSVLLPRPTFLNTILDAYERANATGRDR